MIAINDILVPTDFSEASDAALTYARELASRFSARLHVLYVAENIFLKTFGAETYAAIAPQLQADVVDVAQKQLDELVIDSDKSGPPTTPVVMTSSSPAFAIIDYAKDHGIDLIVMGTHGRGPLAHLVMGSVAERVVRAASCPVLTVRHPQREFVRPDTLTTVAHA